MLEAIGVSEAEERVYFMLLESPGAAAAQVARSTEFPQGQVKELISSLEAKGLVARSPSKAPRFVAAAPDIAIEALILRRQEELERTRAAAALLMRRLGEAARGKTPFHQVEVVVGVEATVQRFIQLQRMARHEIVGLDTPPYGGTPPEAPIDVDFNPLELEHLRRGVRYRIVYDRQAIEFPGMFNTIRTLARAGEQSRIFRGVPMKLAIADGGLALVPLSLEEVEAGALVVRSAPLLAALNSLFEMIWERAVPLQIATATTGPQGTMEHSPEDETLLASLAAGIKDEIIARQLGVSLRTLERRIKRLMDKLGAGTRFQAGLLASQRGWLGPAGGKRSH